MNLDQPCLCPKCGSDMDVCLPIWITPGDSQIQTGGIDYESSMPYDSDNWWCEVCQSHHFPKGQIERSELHKSIVQILQRETAILDPDDADTLADVIVQEMPLVYKAAPELIAALETARNVIRHAAQESTGRVNKEIVGGWIYQAEQIEAIIKTAKGEK